MKKITVFTILAFVCVFQPAQAEEKKRYCRSSSIANINPVMAGVERVVVAVEMVGPENSDELLPNPLKKANLEKLLKELYEERFTSRNGTYLSTNTTGCHDRNDQPVQIIDLVAKGGRKAFEKETRKENTLSVVLFVKIMPKGYAEMEMNSDIVAFHIAHMRPDVAELEKNHSIMVPFAITTSTQEKRISEIIRNVLKNKIH